MVQTALISRLIACCVLASVAAISCEAQAVLVASHVGSADPVNTEGWMASAGSLPIGQSVGPITDGTTPAWFVNDASSAGGSAFQYVRSLTGAEVADAASIGWTLSVTLRVPSSADSSLSASPFASYNDGGTEWFLGFDALGSDTRVQTVTISGGQSTDGPTYTLLGGTSTYNTFQLQKAPGSLTAQLFVNGVQRIPNYGGWSIPGSTAQVSWGSGASQDTGQGNFNAVSFTIAPIPEAGSALLMGLAGLATLALRRVRTVVNNVGSRGRRH